MTVVVTKSCYKFMIFMNRSSATFFNLQLGGRNYLIQICGWFRQPCLHS